MPAGSTIAAAAVNAAAVEMVVMDACVDTMVVRMDAAVPGPTIPISSAVPAAGYSIPAAAAGRRMAADVAAIIVKAVIAAMNAARAMETALMP